MRHGDLRRRLDRIAHELEPKTEERRVYRVTIGDNGNPVCREVRSDGATGAREGAPRVRFVVRYDDSGMGTVPPATRLPLAIDYQAELEAMLGKLEEERARPGYERRAGVVGTGPR